MTQKTKDTRIERNELFLWTHFTWGFQQGEENKQNHTIRWKKKKELNG